MRNQDKITSMRRVFLTILFVVLILVGTGYYLLQITSSSVGPPLTSKYGVSYSTKSVDVPPGAQTIQQNEEGSWIGKLSVVNQAKFLVQGTVLGVVNATVTGSPTHYFVTTHYMVKVNSSLLGSPGTGFDIVVSQNGGIAQISGSMYVNDSYLIIRLSASGANTF
jgi:hypothetical protein